MCVLRNISLVEALGIDFAVCDKERVRPSVAPSSKRMWLCCKKTESLSAETKNCTVYITSVGEI